MIFDFHKTLIFVVFFKPCFLRWVYIRFVLYRFDRTHLIEVVKNFGLCCVGRLTFSYGNKW